MPAGGGAERIGGNGAAGAAVVERMAKAVDDISNLPVFRGPLRLPCGNLVRRLKLLGPLFEELMDGGAACSAGTLEPLAAALEAARELLRSINKGSKLHQVNTTPPPLSLSLPANFLNCGSPPSRL